MSNQSNHFSLEEWSDLGRGRVSPEERAGMQQHLEQGCSACAGVAGLWNMVLEVAGREASFEPPAGAVRCAKALFGVFSPGRVRSPLVRLTRLAGLGPLALEGVRATAPQARHHLFMEGTLLLDMRLQPRPASDAIHVLGQLVDSASAEKQFGNRPVALMRDKDALAQTVTNEFGEFQLEFKTRDNLLLIIELEDGSYLVSQLPSAPEG